ncbi:MAG: NPCBM/NEW2 domain-containing protein [Verrucomicrobia bacterium]|nr:NPCBM/NEW2 domain-containing protein [Verrucomicrobiota bacterium]
MRAIIIPLIIGTVCLGADFVKLERLNLNKARQGWGAPQLGRSVIGRPLRVGGEEFKSGVGTHASGVILVELNGECERFRAKVGVDDETDGKGSVRFKLVADGRRVFQTDVVCGGDKPVTVDVDLQGVERLALVVSDAGDGMAYDHADWCEAEFITGPGLIEVRDLPREEREILTPSPPGEPRINGPRLYGVRPGSPLLFKIPATGERPMEFAVRGLPEDLVVDTDTGIITGCIESDEHKTYKVELIAENRLGRDSREFSIVVGDRIALTPPMGWNSWYVHEHRVTDEVMRAAADAMVNSGLADHGFQYVSIDDCWMNAEAHSDPSRVGPLRDENGDILPNSNFPDMKAMTEYIHSKGLKAGIYTSPGSRTCAGFCGSYGHEAQDAKRFADWGFDLLKYDWCSYTRIAKDNSREELKKPYALMGRILRKQDRDILLNICQYGMGKVWEWGAEVGGNSWRTTGDLGWSFEDIPQAMFRIGFGQNGLEKWAGPGHWNDPDYLLLGYISNWRGGTAMTPLSPNEQYTHVTLWCLLSAPLFLSGDITRLDPFTLGLLTNDEVLAVNQDPLGRQARRVSKDGDLEVWAKEMEDGSRAVGLFNRGPVAEYVTVHWPDIGINGVRRVRDLWRCEDIGEFEGKFEAVLPRHGTKLIRVFDEKK